MLGEGTIHHGVCQSDSESDQATPEGIPDAHSAGNIVVLIGLCVVSSLILDSFQSFRDTGPIRRGPFRTVTAVRVSTPAGPSSTSTHSQSAKRNPVAKRFPRRYTPFPSFPRGLNPGVSTISERPMELVRPFCVALLLRFGTRLDPRGHKKKRKKNHSLQKLLSCVSRHFSRPKVKY